MLKKITIYLLLSVAIFFACNRGSEGNLLVGEWKVEDVELQKSAGNIELDQQMIDQIIDLEITTRLHFLADGSAHITNRAYNIDGLYSFNSETGLLLINRDKNSPRGTKYIVEEVDDEKLVLLRKLNLTRADNTYIRYACSKSSE